MILQRPSLSYIPKRIVSLVPSQTELLFDLGLEDETVGITKFCVHPEKWFRTKTRVGGTKTINIEKIKSLHPDLIIANKEENVKEQIEAISMIAPTWISDIQNLDDALQMISDIGQLTNKVSEANRVVTEIESAFGNINIDKTSHSKALYLIWRKPWMTIGKDTFIHAMLEKLNLKNAFEHLSRYPELSDDDIRNSNASLVLLSSEPYPFKEKHIAMIQELLPEAKIELVDGEMFSWYGSRLLKAPVYFESLF
ncbi:ABC transporter substrate-binding protein [Taibaiella lutea]|uniref:ABC transporter substrate-binding protein n=1 Tax=Taibaiella lutea TaxID=2608001 RepID=A0A5M6CU80_9BACT|nr:helical backbone metal receptor [Taibaiella lutea]KAA5536555.1 ABC transporter substrate-binding protein [Taibaiella lutea]